MRAGIAAAAMLLMGQAQSAPVTYACTVSKPSDVNDDVSAYDQVVVDAEAESVELRIGRTVGTSKPKAMRLAADTYNGDVQVSFVQRDGNTAVTVLDDQSAVSFAMLGDFAASYSFITGLGGYIVTWDCEK